MAEFPTSWNHLQVQPGCVPLPHLQPFLLDSRSWENAKELCITPKGVQQKRQAQLMGVPAGADTERGSFVGGKRDHSGQKITEESGEKTTHCFKSNAVEQISLPNCRAKRPLITEAFLGGFVGLFVKHLCKVNTQKMLVLPK